MAGLFFESGIDRGFEKDLNRMNKQMNTFAKDTEKQGSRINATFKEIGTTIGGIASVAAIGAAGKELINFSKDLETSLTEVSTISAEVTDNFDQYKEALIALSTEEDLAASSAKDLSDAFYDIVSAGYDGQQGLAILEAAARAGTAGFVEAGVAADGLTTVLNAWGKSADEAAQVSDVFFKTVEKGKTTFPELGSNIAQVAPIAASMGVSFEEVSAAIATITKQGTPTSQAFTQVRASLTAMNKVLGDGWAEAMTYQEALLEIQKRAGGSQNELVAMLGRVEAVNAVLALTGQNAQGAADDLGAMTEALGATTTAAEKVTETTDQQINTLKNNILAAFEPLGDEAIGVIASLSEALNEGFKSGDIQQFVSVVLQLTKAFAAYKVSVVALNQVQKLRKNILYTNITAMRLSAATGKTVTAGNIRMAKSFKTLKTAFAANPIGLLVSGLTLAIPLITDFVEKQGELAKETVKLNTEIQKEQQESKSLFDQLKKTNPESEERLDITNKINEKYPDLLKNYDLETANLSDIEKAQKAVNKQIVKRLALQSQETRIAKAGEGLFSAQESILERYLTQLNDVADSGVLADVFRKINDELRDETLSTSELAVKYAEELGIAIESGSLGSTYGGRPTTTYFDVLEASIISSDLALQRFNESKKQIEDFTQAFIGKEDEVIPRPSPIETVTSTIIEEASIPDQLKALELANQKRINEIKRSNSEELEIQKQVNLDLLNNELVYLSKKLELTKDALEKEKIEEQIIDASFKIKIEEAEDPTEKLELNYKKELLLLKKQYAGRKKQQEKFNREALALERTFLKDKLKLTTDEASRLEIEARLDTVNTAINESLQAEELGQKNRIAVIEEANAEILELEKQLQGDITVNNAKEIKERIAEQQALINSISYDTNAEKGTKGDEGIKDIVNLATSSFSELGEGLTKSLSELSQSFSSAFETFSDKSASSAQKMQGLASIIIGLGNTINKAVLDSIGKEAKALEKANAELSDKINNEIYLNNILLERQEIERESSAFLDANYIDVYRGALDKLNASTYASDKAITGLGESFVLTATGSGKSALGLKKVEQDFSFTLDEIVNGAKIKGAKARGTIINIFDPVDLFGGAANADAYIDSFNKVQTGFNNALESMGKTSADMAQFSTEEWATFYDLLDQGGLLADEGTKQLVTTLQDSQQAYAEALEEMKGVIESVAGSLGDSLSDSIIVAMQEGTEAIDEFAKSFNDVLLEMAKASADQIFFRGLFDQLQEEMQSSLGVGGDQDWQDDLLRFYDQLPPAIEGAENFLNGFDQELQNLGFAGITGESGQSGIEKQVEELSTAGRIQQAITEETGGQLVGRLGAIMISNQELLNNSSEALDYAVQNLVYLDKIVKNTDYLPSIEENTRKMVDKLGSV